MQLKDKIKVNDDPSLETEADILGATALQRGNAQAEVQRKGKDLSGHHSQPLTAESQTAQMIPSGFSRPENDNDMVVQKRPQKTTQKPPMRKANRSPMKVF